MLATLLRLVSLSFLSKDSPRSLRVAAVNGGVRVDRLDAATRPAPPSPPGALPLFQTQWAHPGYSNFPGDYAVFRLQCSVILFGSRLYAASSICFAVLRS